MSKYFIGIPVDNIETSVNPKDSHLTVAYLGNLKDKKLPKIKKAISKLISNLRDFNIEIKNYQMLKNKYPVAKIRYNHILNSLNEDINKELKTTTGNEYLPHITLGSPYSFPLLSKYEKKQIPVKEIDIYKIDPSKNSRYKIIKSYKLPSSNILQKIYDEIYNIIGDRL